MVKNISMGGIAVKKADKKELLMLALKHIGGGAAVLVIFYFISKLFGSVCPTYRFFKIPCPFCGMTRAHMAALRLDFKAAMEYNPVFFLGIPCIFLLTHDCLFTEKTQKYRKIIGGILLGIIFAAYVVRVCLFGFDFL
jgi:hypothetical protein